MKSMIILLAICLPMAGRAAEPPVEQVPLSLVRVTAIPDYRLLGFATATEQGIRFDYYLQGIAAEEVLCTVRIDEISGPFETLYESWHTRPATLKLTLVKGVGVEEFVEIRPTRRCDYEFKSRPARA